MEFVRGEADVLVCTTIVEAGLDIPSANTLIVERADMLGLAQLYQIRGRVGRSRERAYAYLFYPSSAALTEEAGQRAWRRCPTTPSSAPASRSRCATWRSAAPATCWATSSPATSRRSASSCTWRCSTRRSRRWPATRADEAPEPVRIDVPVDAYVPGDYVPYEAAKIEIHRRVVGRARDRRPDRPARGARGPLRPGARAARQPDQAPGRAHQARPRGRQGRRLPRRAGWRVSPIELDSRGAKALRARLPEAIYESGRSTVAVRIPDEAAARFAGAGGRRRGDPRGGHRAAGPTRTCASRVRAANLGARAPAGAGASAARGARDLRAPRLGALDVAALDTTGP